jgi:hypothetical protein
VVAHADVVESVGHDVIVELDAHLLEQTALDLVVRLHACQPGLSLLELAALDLVVLLHARQPALGLLLPGAQVLVLAPHLAHLVHHQPEQRPHSLLQVLLLLMALLTLALAR